MKIWDSLIIAFSTYSSIPMPKADWKPENMRYSMCFFPLIGVVIGGLFWGLSALCRFLSVGDALFAAAATALPAAVSGGIHLDGYCDVSDALASRREREKKLEILKDPHTGAFAVISCALYLLLTYGLWTELERGNSAVFVVAAGFVLSRSLSALSVVSFRCAAGSSLLAAFSNASHKKVVRAVMIAFLLLCAGSMLWMHPALGGAALAAAGLSFLYYRIVSYRQFGGINGDLAGYFLQICELSVLGAVVLMQKIMEVIAL